MHWIGSQNIGTISLSPKEVEFPKKVPQNPLQHPGWFQDFVRTRSGSSFANTSFANADNIVLLPSFFHETLYNIWWSQMVTSHCQAPNRHFATTPLCNSPAEKGSNKSICVFHNLFHFPHDKSSSILQIGELTAPFHRNSARQPRTWFSGVQWKGCGIWSPTTTEVWAGTLSEKLLLRIFPRWNPSATRYWILFRSSSILTHTVTHFRKNDVSPIVRFSRFLNFFRHKAMAVVPIGQIFWTNHTS